LKQWLAALKARGLNILVQDLLEQVMYGHNVLLAAFSCFSEGSATKNDYRLPESVHSHGYGGGAAARAASYGQVIFCKTTFSCCACLIPIEFERLGQNHAEAR
jgi:hypothetical protein